MSKAWPLVAMGEVLRKSEESVPIDPNTKYREVTIKLWGKGVMLRREASGTEIAAPRRSVVRAGQFILSRIDARNGAFGIVPPALDGAVVSNDFPSFNLNTQRIIPEYLGWLSRSTNFVDLCRAASEGTTNRVRIKEEKLLATSIALPSLGYQQLIVARIEKLVAKIEEARRLRRLAIDETEALLKAELHRKFVEQEELWPRALVGDIAEIIDPNPSHRMPRYSESGIPFISTVDFDGTEEIRKRTKKYVAEETYIEQRSRCNFAPNDILYSRIGTIGAARILNEVWPFALSHVLVVLKPNALVEPRFLLWYMRSDSVVSQAEEATRSTGVPDLGIKKIRGFHMPLPAMSEQRSIIAYLDKLQSRVGDLQHLQSQTFSEIDTMLPSILAKAFQGTL